jgi:hypothetical protein
MIPLSFKEITDKIMEILKLKGFKVKRVEVNKISVISFSISPKIKLLNFKIKIIWHLCGKT